MLFSILAVCFAVVGCWALFASFLEEREYYCNLLFNAAFGYFLFAAVAWVLGTVQLVSANPIWMHTAEYANNALKTELLCFSMVWCAVSIPCLYLSATRLADTWKLGVFFAWVFGSASLWCLEVLCFAQRWMG